MALLNANVMSLVDWAKRIDPDGKTPYIAEVLEQNNAMAQDMVHREGNLPTGHLSTIRTGLPAVSWRLINGPAYVSKSTTAQVQEQCGILDAWSEVSEDLVTLEDNPMAIRLTEAVAFLEAMRQEWSETVVYGNSSVAPAEFVGLSPRYSALTGAGNSQNVISAGGTGSDNSSIWLVVHGEYSFFGIFPKGSRAGLSHEDLGLVTLQSSDSVQSGRMRVYQDRFIWKSGICLRDWRYVVRICNIDVSNLVSGVSAADLSELMVRAIHRLPGDDPFSVGKPVFYMNRTVLQMLDIQRRNAVQAGGQLSYDVVDGRRTATFRGIPVRKMDAILNTEAAVS